MRPCVLEAAGHTESQVWQDDSVMCVLLWSEAKSGLCTLITELNLGDRVLGEVGKNSFVALPDKGPQQAEVRKTVCPALEQVVRSVVILVQRGRDQLWTFF